MAEKLTIDWASGTIGVVDPPSGEEWRRQIFVAALVRLCRGALERDAADWIAAHLYAFFGHQPNAAGTGARQSEGWDQKPSCYKPGINRFICKSSHYRACWL
jgi:hypothetical protein